ncbi:hypothetical protein OIE66_31115 [Nonomuraea sp. NBC_01738]|uniref:hypothetical protein n=1 Tax=Nonomuraea sp. NBC_01738 TaxID=2976003 RepID=UPI002E14B28E|nr:hypothetical protein OIE66_31115 [Nonomuraea sp. NBC_01738]
MDIISAAEGYLLLHARLLDRLRFEALYRGGDRRRVLDVLRGYQNADGGFGHAIEPDMRGAGSQPETVEVAFHILDELGAFDDPMVGRACAYLESITTKEGGVPFVLPSVRDTPRAPWWQSDDDPPAGLVPTASIAGLLHKHGSTHPWLGPATAFCWEAIAAITDETTPYEARAVFTFLDLVDDRERAEAEFARVRDALLATVSLEPDAPGAAHYPLDFAPAPTRLPLFTPEVLDRHLDALVASQSDGGWHGNWTMWTPIVEHEWGGYLTVGKLNTLRAYGRL